MKDLCESDALKRSHIPDEAGSFSHLAGIARELG
jgi:hypothetical protein